MLAVNKACKPVLAIVGSVTFNCFNLIIMFVTHDVVRLSQLAILENKMTKLVTFTALMMFVFSCQAELPEKNSKPLSKFNYLEFDGGFLRSTHDIKLSMKAPTGYTLIKPLSYQATFNEVKFNVSVAGFVKEKTLLFVSAEKLANNEGNLDYSHFEPTDLNGVTFYKRVRCAELTSDDVEAAADLRYLKDNGYDFHPAIYLTHFFKNSSDGNSEYVVVFGEQVSNCSDDIITDDFKSSFDGELNKVISLTKIGSNND